MDRIEQLSQYIAMVETMIESGEIERASADRCIAPWRAELAMLQTAEAARRQAREDALQGAGVVAHGVRRPEHGQSMTQWFVIRRGARGWYPALQRLGISMQPEHCTHAYDCCGRWYSWGASVKVSPTRILVRVSSYQNV